MMTRQEIFNIVATHLIRQGKPSVIDNGGNTIRRCLYRGPNGTKCAVGVLISDEMYDSNIEDVRVFAIVRYLPKICENDIYFLNSLQCLHDDPYNWPDITEALKSFASCQKLTMPVVEKVEGAVK